MSLFFLKITITSLSVLLLGIIADRGNPRLAGILTGFPIGTAIVTMFIAIENGPAIAAQASLYSLAALSLNPLFAFAYYVIGSRIKGNYRYKSTLCLALIVYLATASMVANIRWEFATAVSFLLVVTVFINNLLTRVPLIVGMEPVRATLLVLLGRMALASIVVIGVTKLVELVGPEWAGVFTPFPVTLVPILIILHSTHGKNAAFALIKGFGYSFLSTGIYLATITYLLPIFGVLKSSLFGLLFAGFYILVLEAIPWLILEMNKSAVSVRLSEIMSTYPKRPISIMVNIAIAQFHLM